MGKRLIICISIMILSYSIYAQENQFGVVVNSGFSQMKTHKSDFFDSKWMFSGNIGLSYYRKFNLHFSLGFEVLFAKIDGKNVYDKGPFLLDDDLGPPPTGKYYFEKRSHAQYTAIPVFYKYSLGKLAAKIGVQTMFLNLFFQKSTYMKDEYGIKSTETWVNNETTKFQLDLGPKIGIEYSITHQLALRCEYYQGLVFPDYDYLPNSISNRQLTLGLQYSLTQKKKFSEQ